jgi:hypothetical protein
VTMVAPPPQCSSSGEVVAMSTTLAPPFCNSFVSPSPACYFFLVFYSY